uniref:Golgi apparatus membrane protein TVP23 n=1 Tax=Chlamydomonas leiostraca TaxID=1034604 RepID=A0A7S0RGN6_9CHLO|mmetsp:Transcript_22342/g.56860  ORF Transcript_22342/g.56860 Transcript_22342/m.56860 type:complete len:177 (+) Transcript_22342:111-641(+)|eukprot:CAMPEP_0202863528 /NCGR_PEP_ID=MMETSP1391-20130828/4134_1 /ASSEMBLY_ACC=CAM_ASM_000867 /TAXON_ID=1034604 /ORGANISM="Chlamydomonas leiostraca, Strain SAG 11-49" /LENGTH=176 /DNA_ID=CAMNT_0049543175 /DNA_START=110 /DNA_END=640 /DNA_ORIENTATION=-
MVSSESHPFALFFHWAFKVAVWIFYCIGDWVIKNNFVMIFVVSVVLIALDFWTVKNVTGRKLVGLRWWNEANDTGSAWRFEAAPPGTRVIHEREKKMFWIGLFANMAAWVVLAFLALVRLKWDFLIIPIIGCVMASSNLVGYYKCSGEAKDQLKSMTSSFMAKAASTAIQHQVGRV